MATYLNHSHGQRLAAGVYAAVFLVLTVTFATLNWHILFRNQHMLGLTLSEQERRTIISRGLTGVLPYALATAVAAASPYATLAICAAVAVFYATLAAARASTPRPPSD
jgi:hypothetical protein